MNRMRRTPVGGVLTCCPGRGGRGVGVCECSWAVKRLTPVPHPHTLHATSSATLPHPHAHRLTPTLIGILSSRLRPYHPAPCRQHIGGLWTLGAVQHASQRVKEGCGAGPSVIVVIAVIERKARRPCLAAVEVQRSTHPALRVPLREDRERAIARPKPSISGAFEA